jgi:hypothetical protein
MVISRAAFPLSEINLFTIFFSQFFASDDRIKAVRQMIMAGTVEQRLVALDKLLPYQRSDFEGIFRVMDGEYNSSYEQNQSFALLSLLYVQRRP